MSPDFPKKKRVIASPVVIEEDPLQSKLLPKQEIFNRICMGLPISKEE